MKRYLLAIALCFALCSTLFLTTAFAQNNDTQATKEDIQKYFDTVHSRDMVDKIMDSMLKPMQQIMHEEYIQNKDKLPQDFEERMNKRTSDLVKNMPWDEMMQAMIPAYRAHLTKGDIAALIAFYSSPTGQKLQRELPEMISESTQAMMPIMRKYVTSVQDQLEQETAELIKQSEKKSGQATKN